MKFIQQKIILVLILFSVFIFTGLALYNYSWLSNMTNKHKKRILVFLNSAPYSSDPLEYDSFYHHIAFGSVFGNLVSQYKLGEHSPELAQSWRVSPDQKEWVFTIKKGLTFSDGTPITAKSFVLSWLRLAKIMKERHSRSGFFENLLGYDKLNKSSIEIDGLQSSEENLVIKLIKPMPGLLDKISFGLFSLVHPSQFDQVSGKWIANKKNLISSGAYQMITWNDNQLVLSLRKEYPSSLHHENPIEEIEIFWKKDFHPTAEIDIAMGSELSTPPNSNFILHGGPPSSIFFMRIMGWQDSESFFYKKENRLAFRNEFYSQLEKSGFKPTRSFFPLIINGIAEMADSSSEPISIDTTKNIRIPSYPLPAFPSLLPDQTIDMAIESANKFNLLVKRNPIDLITLFDEIEKNSKKSTWDIVRYGTGILASDPIDDVKFMFQSKEGILLPDESGEIAKELDKNPIDLQKINLLLWNDGIIWPVAHYSSGLWGRPDLDFSQINLVLPPTSFQWIGWKN